MLDVLKVMNFARTSLHILEGQQSSIEDVPDNKDTPLSRKSRLHFLEEIINPGRHK